MTLRQFDPCAEAPRSLVVAGATEKQTRREYLRSTDLAAPFGVVPISVDLEVVLDKDVIVPGLAVRDVIVRLVDLVLVVVVQMWVALVALALLLLAMLAAMLHSDLF